ncbi:hypothetical protein [Pontibacter arcticus]|uniref:hypothetical protein n=1 Tax=Pontibacter arcticus TaxID=2080288 RepID=UPI000DD4DC83|nr:hypothetical protein [Pontibacter arcticus]
MRFLLRNIIYTSAFAVVGVFTNNYTSATELQPYCLLVKTRSKGDLILDHLPAPNSILPNRSINQDFKAITAFQSINFSL